MPAEAAEYGLTSSDGTPVSLEMLGGFDEARAAQSALAPALSALRSRPLISQVRLRALRLAVAYGSIDILRTFKLVATAGPPAPAAPQQEGERTDLPPQAPLRSSVLTPPPPRFGERKGQVVVANV